MAKDELTLQDLTIKHNELCELLDEMKLNPLADFYSLKVDVTDTEDDEPLVDDAEDDPEDNEELVDIEEVEDEKPTFG